MAFARLKSKVRIALRGRARRRRSSLGVGGSDGALALLGAQTLSFGCGFLLGDDSGWHDVSDVYAAQRYRTYTAELHHTWWQL